jgi:hypothetical protein
MLRDQEVMAYNSTMRKWHAKHKSVGRPNQAMRLEILELTEQTLTLNLRGIEARALR